MAPAKVLHKLSHLDGAELSAPAINRQGSAGEAAGPPGRPVGNFCYHAITEGNRLQEQKLWGIFPGQKGPHNLFWTAVAKVAA